MVIVVLPVGRQPSYLLWRHGDGVNELLKRTCMVASALARRDEALGFLLNRFIERLRVREGLEEARLLVAEHWDGAHDTRQQDALAGWSARSLDPPGADPGERAPDLRCRH